MASYPQSTGFFKGILHRDFFPPPFAQPKKRKILFGGRIFSWNFSGFFPGFSWTYPGNFLKNPTPNPPPNTPQTSLPQKGKKDAQTEVGTRYDLEIPRNSLEIPIKILDVPPNVLEFPSNVLKCPRNVLLLYLF